MMIDQSSETHRENHIDGEEIRMVSKTTFHLNHPQIFHGHSAVLLTARTTKFTRPMALPNQVKYFDAPINCTNAQTPE